MASYQYPPVPPNRALDFTKIVHHDTYLEIDSAKADLCGKIVCITGASKGIGRATALSFAKAGAEAIVIGARSVLTSLESEIASAAQVSGKKAPKVLRLELDVTDQVSVENAAKDIEKTLGRLDILINNAGYLSSFTPMIESDPMQWWTNWEVNIRGVYLVTRSLLPLMIKGGEKTIINLASIGALNLTPGASGYQPSKNALLRFTEFICADYAKDGILAYSIHPGGVITDMGLKMPAATHKNLVDKPELSADVLVSLTSKRREWLADNSSSVQTRISNSHSAFLEQPHCMAYHSHCSITELLKPGLSI